MSISEEQVNELNLFCNYLATMEDPVFSVMEIPSFATDGEEVFIRCKRARNTVFVPAIAESDWVNFLYDKNRKYLLVELAKSVRYSEETFSDSVWELLADFVSDAALDKLKAHENDIRNDIDFEEHTFEDIRKLMIARRDAHGKHLTLLVVFENKYYIDAYNSARGLRSGTCRRYRKYTENGRKFVQFGKYHRIYEDKWTYDTEGYFL